MHGGPPRASWRFDWVYELVGAAESLRVTHAKRQIELAVPLLAAPAVADVYRYSLDAVPLRALRRQAQLDPPRRAHSTMKSDEPQ